MAYDIASKTNNFVHSSASCYDLCSPIKVGLPEWDIDYEISLFLYIYLGYDSSF